MTAIVALPATRPSGFECTDRKKTKSAHAFVIEKAGKMKKLGGRRKIILGAFLLSFAAYGFGARANDLISNEPLDRGQLIAKEAAERDAGFNDFSAEVEMILTNRNGTESRRHFRVSILEVADDGDKSLMVFNRPRDVDGTALLTFSHKTANDDQWIYLPALKRVKRISATNRSGPFVGSEFAYEDMVWPEIEKYSCRWLRDEDIDGVAAHVIERTPNYKNSGYSRQLVWYDKKELRIVRIEFFDRKGEPLKVLTVKGYQRYKDKFWRADEMHMVNTQNGKSTRLAWNNYSFEDELSDSAFQIGKLERLR